MMMLWHITIWFMASMQFFFNFIFTSTQKKGGGKCGVLRRAGHFIDLRYFIVSSQTLTMWLGSLKKRSPLGLVGICVGSSSSWPVGHLAWPRPIGQCQAAACHPAILRSRKLKASQLVSLPSAYLECLLAYSNCKLQYLIGFSTKDVPKSHFDYEIDGV